MTNDTEKVEVPSAAFASVFTWKIGLQKYQVPETRGEDWTRKTCLRRRRTRLRSTWINWLFISPWGLMGCTHECRGMWMMSEWGHSHLSLKDHGMAWHGEVSEDWKRVDITPVIERSKKEYPGNYRAVSQFLERWKSSWKAFPNTWIKGRWLGVVNRALWRGSNAWPNC